MRARKPRTGAAEKKASLGLFDGLAAVPAHLAEDGFFSPLALFDRSFDARPLAGLDEAGRGPLAGPLVAAAVILPDDFDSPLIQDSKKLKDEERRQAFELITQKALHIGVAVLSPQDVDLLNPLRASMRAMAQGLEKIPIPPKLALADGNKIPSVSCPVLAVVKGDGKSLCIAAASIIAKVTRDDLMLQEHERFPDYGFAKHKGYGTKEHLAALKRLGPSPIHRLTYKGVLPLEQAKSPANRGAARLF
ncbi:MAG: ribonuclease HII [Deltaproteobacteria bacterium]|jgi:ribonuclease HII|nr:ribonuclease HII [Deltaproteobacteria bacterium]